MPTSAQTRCADVIEDFWYSLTPRTSTATQNNQLLKGLKVRISGHIRNTDEVPHNDDWGYSRAQATDTVLRKLSGNTEATDLAPMSEGGRGIATDDPTKEQEKRRTAQGGWGLDGTMGLLELFAVSLESWPCLVHRTQRHESSFVIICSRNTVNWYGRTCRVSFTRICHRAGMGPGRERQRFTLSCNGNAPGPALRDAWCGPRRGGDLFS